MTNKYIGIVHEGEENFGISFYEFPGCVSVADTFEELREVVKEALEFHIEGMKEDFLKIPRPATFEEVGEWADEHEYSDSIVAMLVIELE